MSAYDVTADGKLQIQEVQYNAISVSKITSIHLIIISVINLGYSIVSKSALVFLFINQNICIFVINKVLPITLDTVKTFYLFSLTSSLFQIFLLFFLLYSTHHPLFIYQPPSASAAFPLHILFISRVYDNDIACTIFKKNTISFPGLLRVTLSHSLVVTRSRRRSTQTIYLNQIHNSVVYISKCKEKSNLNGLSKIRYKLLFIDEG